MKKEKDGENDQFVLQALEAIRTGKMKKLVQQVKSTRVIGTFTCKALELNGSTRSDMRRVSIPYLEGKPVSTRDIG